ncbi:Zn(2)-C6 fungal-type domain-containing protein [Trichoderma simmonsii]|uniref:Zn(2)-C6 fungal-type domain-containing protein n=1 Tax=Trichoderma simmonsii TaxID=1491479 RepID=A0A8G0LK49_9HYPO|nr:Zn(2)-C6 fungal-type domain-containing protein [Trichoderma simmonsii]
MLPNRSITGFKKRARTGCLSCRRRRRKCDEQKPRCSSCDTRGISCQYPDGLIFIPAPASRYQGLRDPDLNQEAQTYDTIEFVENATSFQFTDARTAGVLPEPASVAVETRQSPFAPETVTPQHIDIQEEHGEEDSVTLEDPAEEPRSRGLPSSNPNNASTVTVASDSSPAVTPAARVNPASPRKARLEKASAYDFPTNFGLPPGDQEIALLRHFRDNLCPWLDIGGSKSAAGLDIMVLAKSSRPLMSSILWLASEHHASVSLQAEIDIIPDAVTYRQHATQGLELESDGTVKHIGHGLLTLKELLGSKTRQWTGVLARSTIYDTIITFVPPEETIDSLFWALLKFDLAASIIGKRSPKISICTIRDAASRLVSRPGARYDCQASLLRLGECLHMVYGTDYSLSPIPDRTNRHDSTTSDELAKNFWSRWASLWRECQDWHKHRAMEVQPLLVVDSIEVSSISAPDDPSFPMLLFTEPLALVANVTYYITSFLLLSRRPRLSKLWAHSSLVTSMAWHAQSIAGAVISNHHPESWDPVVFAGVLMAGKEMTHESQQTALLKQLHKMINAVGLDLKSEVEELQSSWIISHHDSH